MNERIDELLWQAGGYTKLSYPDDTFLDGRYALTQEQLEKFAELIVRECIKVCAEKETAFQNESLSAQSQVGRDAWRDKRDGAGECVFGIKEHFGVEE